MNERDERILSAATMTRERRQLLALDLGMSVMAMLQQMLRRADDPEEIRIEPALTRAVRKRRERLRRTRSGAGLL